MARRIKKRLFGGKSSHKSTFGDVNDTVNDGGGNNLLTGRTHADLRVSRDFDDNPKSKHSIARKKEKQFDRIVAGIDRPLSRNHPLRRKP